MGDDDAVGAVATPAARREPEVGGGGAGAAPVLHVSNRADRVVVTMLTIALWEHLNNTYALRWENHHADDH